MLAAGLAGWQQAQIHVIQNVTSWAAEIVWKIFFIGLYDLTPAAFLRQRRVVRNVYIPEAMELKA
jgi:hypothetical protein